MTASIFSKATCFATQQAKHHISITLIREDDFDAWLKKQNNDLSQLVTSHTFHPKEQKNLIERDKNGQIVKIFVLIANSLGIYDGAKLCEQIRSLLPESILKSCSFDFKAHHKLNSKDVYDLYVGWGLSHYVFDTYKDDKKPVLKLLWHKDADKKRINSYLEAAFLLRNLINLPANDLGPDEMEDASQKLAATHKASLKVVKGAKLKKDFPLIHTVGMGSPRAPRLIDITYGKAKDPKLVIVGKGVVFDTGGLDIKPSQYMRLMKKDMGGAAHALALGHMIMALKLPINLRILIPCVENAVGGASFRPGDIIKSRKGLTVENTNTDAEGRLILADALALASEDKPDLIIDFATLTGSARAGLGPDIPAMFSTCDDLAKELQSLSFEHDDPLWAMPLWEPYKKTIESSVADLVNSAGVPGDLIYSALFLKQFLHQGPDWIHLDIYAWENNGKPGRTKGGTEMGLRPLLALLEKRYA